MEFNGQKLPNDFLAAALSQNRKTRKYFIKKKKEQLADQAKAVNSDNFYSLADIYNKDDKVLNQIEGIEDILIPQALEGNGMDKIIQNFLEKSEFLQGVKDNNKVSCKQRNDSSLLYQKYSKISLDYGNLPMPFLQKLKNGTLYIPNSFRINEGNAISLKRTILQIEKIQKLELKKAIFDRTQISDIIFANVLNSILLRSEFISLTSVCNEISDESSKQISFMLEPQKSKEFKSAQLQELQLISNKIDSESADRILESIKLSTKLRSLTIQKAQFSNRQFLNLFSFIQQSQFIQSLDLSWNSLSSGMVIQLLTALEKNKSIEYLNLSHIKMDEILQIQPHISKFSKFIKENDRLNHLNLTSIELPNQLMLELLISIKQSISLNCVHLCNNFLSIEAEKYIMQKLKPYSTLSKKFNVGNQDRDNAEIHENEFMNKITKEIYFQDSGEKKNEIELYCNKILNKFYQKKHEKIYDTAILKEIFIEQKTVQKSYQKQSKQTAIKREEIHRDFRNSQIQELEKNEIVDENFDVVSQKQSLKSNKSKSKKKNNAKNTPKKKKQEKEKELSFEELREQTKTDKCYDQMRPLIFQRILGHPEILNSKSWKVSNECWMCDKWKYTLIFWDISLGFKYQIKDHNLEDFFRKLIINSKKEFESKMVQSIANIGKAFIVGDFTQWEPRRMMRIDEFCAIIEKNQEIIHDEENRKHYNEDIIYRLDQIIHDQIPYANQAEKINFPQELFGNELDKKQYSKQLFVYCDFIKPGKHQYMVTFHNKIIENIEQIEDKTKKKKIQKDEREPMVSEIQMTSYHQFISSAYLGEYECKLKIDENNQNIRTFKKDSSVFKDWKIDKPKSVQDGFTNETKYWSVPKFIKDQNEVEQITNFMKNEAEFLKNIFIINSSKSSYPSIKMQSFNNFVQELGIINEQFSVQKVESVFKTVTQNIDKDLVGIIPEKEMCRFQFYEAIVRLGIYRYLQTKQKVTAYESVKYLINDVMKNKSEAHKWMEWRYDKLWTVDVDDLIKSNLVPFQKLYKFIMTTKKSKTFTIDDAKDMFCGDIVNIGLPEHIIYCWGMSKMTIENDIKYRDKYLKLEQPEFLEFFARVSEIACKDSSELSKMPLVEKIKYLMDLVFPEVGQRRLQIQIEREYFSESEEDYDEEKYFI